MSRAFTRDEMRDKFIDQCRDIARYWANTTGTPEERCMGVVHSILTLIDGCSSGFPCALTLTCEPHPDDKAFHQAEDENWVEPETAINADDMLHELLYRR